MINFATIGTGSIVRSFIGGTLLTGGRMHLKAVYSRDAQRGAAFAGEFGCTDIVTDLAVLAERSDIDAVYIASPNSLHYEQAMLMLTHKKHALVEKPAAVTPEQLQRLNAAADANGVIFAEAIIPMYLPSRGILRDAIKEIGDISSARFQYCQLSSRYNAYLCGKEPNVFSKRFAGGALMDLGVYCVYPAIELFGVPDSVAVNAVMLDTGVDAAVCAVLGYGKRLVSITASKIAQSDLPSEILGENGSIRIGYISKYDNIELVKNGVAEKLCGELSKEEQMSFEANAFYRFITEPEQSKAEYTAQRRLMLDVCATMRLMRGKAGIAFPQDAD